MGWPVRCSYGETGQCRVHVLDVELLRVEFATDPFQPLLILWVVWISQDMQELGIAPDATDVLGRTSSPTLEAYRVRRTELGLEHFLDAEDMFPSVATVVFIEETVTCRWCDIGKGHATLV